MAVGMDESSAVVACDPEHVLWSPSPRANRAGRLCADAIVFGMTLASWWVGFALLRDWPAVIAFLAGAALLLSIVAVGVAIHEAGHALAAHRAGMTLMAVQVFNLRLEARRRGWSASWRKSPMGSHVLAIHDLARPFRAQSMRHVSGGPLANAIACVAFAIAALLAPRPATTALALLAAWNGAICVANLVPFTRTLPTDGLQLLRWWRGIPDGHPALASTRAMAMSIAGVTADRLPAALTDRLARGSEHDRILARWIELKAHQNRGEWAGAAALADAVEKQFGALDAPVAKAYAELRELFDIEIAFSRALASGNAALLRATPLEKAAGASRWIPLRARGLLAAMAGDAAAVERLLAEAEREVEDGIDGASRISEATLRAAVRARLEAAAPA
jgi:hypothetical protein